MKGLRGIFSLLVLLFPPPGWAVIDYVSSTSVQMGTTSNLDVYATSDSRSGNWFVKRTATPAGWTVDNGLFGDSVTLALGANSQGKFSFKATPSQSAVNGSVTFELWYDQGLFVYVKVDTKTYALTRYDSSNPSLGTIIVEPSALAVLRGSSVSFYARDVGDAQSGIASCRLYYKGPGASSYSSVDMVHDVLDVVYPNSRKANVPTSSLSSDGTLYMYCEAVNGVGGKTTSPTYQKTIDSTGPSIGTPTVTQDYLGNMSVDVNVADGGAGVASVNLWYKDLLDGGDFGRLAAMTYVSGNTWHVDNIPNPANPAGEIRTRFADGTTVKYHIEARDSANNPTSSSDTTVMITVKPNAPVLNDPTPVSKSAINLGWTHDGQNVTGFILQRKTGAGGTWSQIASLNSSVRSYSDSGLAEYTLYYYRVLAYSNTGRQSDWSGEKSSRTLDATAPSIGTPTVTQDYLGNMSVDVNVTDGGAGVASVNLWYKDLLDGGDFGRLAAMTYVSGNTWHVDNIPNPANPAGEIRTRFADGTTVKYHIEARDSANNPAPSSDTTVMITVKPNAPMLNDPTPVSKSAINLGWTHDGQNVTGFIVQRKTGAGGAWSQIASLDSSRRSYSDGGLTEYTLYYYRVLAYSNTGRQSDWSAEKPGQTPDATAPSIGTPTVTQDYLGNMSVSVNVTDGGSGVDPSQVWFWYKERDNIGDIGGLRQMTPAGNGRYVLSDLPKPGLPTALEIRQVFPPNSTINWRVEAKDYTGNLAKTEPDSSTLIQYISFGLTSPSQDQTGVDPRPTFTWGAVSGIDGYRLELTQDTPIGANPFVWRTYHVNSATTSYSIPPEDAIAFNTPVWWRVVATNGNGGILENTGSWRKFSVRSQLFSGNISNQDPASFTEGYMSDVYVAAQNTGDPCIMAVKIVSYPSGWTVDNGALGDFIVCNNANSMAAGQQLYPGPFKATPPVTGGSGTFTWELWKVSYVGVYPVGLTTFDQKLCTYTSTISTAAGVQKFHLLSPTNSAVNTGTRPLFMWTVATNSSSYHLVVETQGIPPISVVDVFTTNTWYKPDQGFLQNSTRYNWRVVASNQFGRRSASETAWQFDTGSSTMETRIIGYKQTDDRRIRLEIAADFNAFGFTVKPNAVWVEYTINNNLWVQRVAVTECTTPAGNFYYAEIDNAGASFGMGDKIDISVGMSQIPYIGFPSMLPPLGSVYGSQMTTWIHANKVSLDISDAGRGYIGFKPHSVPYSVVESGTDEHQITVNNLTIENNLFCYARVNSYNTKTSKSLRGGAGFDDPIGAYWSSATWPQILANITFGQPYGPHYIRGKKIDVFNLISLDTILGEPDVIKHASFKYLSTEVLDAGDSIQFYVFKGGLGTTYVDAEVPLLNLVDTILDLVPFLFDGLETSGNSSKKQTAIEVVGKFIFKTMSKKLVDSPDFQQKILSGNPEALVDIVDAFLKELTKEAIKGQLVQDFIVQGFSPENALEMAGETMKKVTVAQAILNSAIRLTQYAAYPPDDYLQLTANSHSVSFDPSQVQYQSAVPLKLTLGAAACTNAPQAWIYSVGGAASFEVAVMNSSSTQTIRNLWLGMDIYAPSDIDGSKGALYEYTNKVENTLTPITDMSTGRKGRIKFRVVELNGVATNFDYTANAENGLTRFLDLPPGGSARFRADPYLFDSATTLGGVHSYAAGKYMTHIAIWENGYPGDTFGIPASMVFDSRSFPIYLTAFDSPPAPASLVTESSPANILVGWTPVARLTTPDSTPINRDVEWIAVYRNQIEQAVFDSESNVIAIVDAHAAEQFVVDTNVTAGATWYYGAKTVDSLGRQSAPSPVVAGRIPAGNMIVNPETLASTIAGTSTALIGRVVIGNLGYNQLAADLVPSVTWIRSSVSQIILASGASTSVEVYVDAGLLAGGEHSANLQIASPGADGSPKNVEVRVNKSVGPLLTVSPQSLFAQIPFDYTPGVVNSSVVLSNDGDQELAWSASGTVAPSGGFVSFVSSNGVIAPGSRQIIYYSYLVDTLWQGGHYSATLHFVGNQINGNQLAYHYTSITGAPVSHTGSIYVNIGPSNVASLGASWRLDSGEWQTNGALLSGIQTGQHAISYSPLLGWIAPPVNYVMVIAGQTNVVSGIYSLMSGSNQSPIVFASDRSGNWDIWRMNPDGSGLMQLTTSELSDTDPQWSPDGQQIAYRNAFDKLMVMDASGANQREVLTARGAGNIRWAPDGTYLVFNKLGPTSDWDAPYYRVNLDGTEEMLFLPGFGKGASMSFGPQGTNVIWIGASANWSPNAELYTAPVVGGVVDIGAKVQLITNGVEEGCPKYSPGFTNIIFERTESSSGWGDPKALYIRKPSFPGGVRITYDANPGPMDPFVYESRLPLNGMSGGKGWVSAWTSMYADGVETWEYNFPAQNNYPVPTGGKIRLNPPDGQTRTAFRYFAPVTTGRLYVAYMMNIQFPGPQKFSGLSFMDNNYEKIFFGEVWDADQRLGVALNTTTYEIIAVPGYDYLIIGCYDFDTREAKVVAYHTGFTNAPLQEPITWAGVHTFGSGYISQIDGIRLASGSGGSVTGTPGQTWFDEVRVGRSWQELIGYDDGSAFDPDYSPDGNSVVFTRKYAGLGDICVVDQSGSYFTNITKSSSDEMQPHWSKAAAYTNAPLIAITPLITNVPTRSSAGLQVSVVANTPWHATSGVAWISVAGGSSSNNEGILFSVAAYGGANSRTGTIAVAGGGVTSICKVIQLGTLDSPPGSFERWIGERGLSGNIPELFQQVTNISGIANGFIYVFGSSVSSDSSLLRMRIVDGQPIIEVPEQDESTKPYAQVEIIGSANLAEWNLHVVPAQNTNGQPTGWVWRKLVDPTQSNAFFRLHTELK